MKLLTLCGVVVMIGYGVDVVSCQGEDWALCPSDKWRKNGSCVSCGIICRRHFPREQQSQFCLDKCPNSGMWKTAEAPPKPTTAEAPPKPTTAEAPPKPTTAEAPPTAEGPPKPTTAEAPPKPMPDGDEGTQTIIIILLLLLAAVVVGAGAIIYCIKMKKCCCRRTTPPDPEPPDPDPLLHLPIQERGSNVRGELGINGHPREMVVAMACDGRNGRALQTMLHTAQKTCTYMYSSL